MDQLPELSRLHPEETLRGLPPDSPTSTALDFWRWAYSDLMANNIRGVFAEWLVSRILDAHQPPRDPWAPSDLVVDKVRLEVKCAAYVQRWHKEDTPKSSITFQGLKARTWDYAAGFSSVAAFNADIYVFCIQTCETKDTWDAFDLGQWRFWVLGREVLERLDRKSISLSTVIREACGELDVLGLRTAVREMIKHHQRL